MAPVLSSGLCSAIHLRLLILLPIHPPYLIVLDNGIVYFSVYFRVYSLFRPAAAVPAAAAQPGFAS